MSKRKQKDEAAGSGLAKAIELGYLTPKVVEGRGACGVMGFMFTGGLVFGIREEGYDGRYCYPTLNDAVEALAKWDGTGDPGGPWIKLKSATEERTGPGLAG